jgi:O-antigen/teichoic acid export membrane protein
MNLSRFGTNALLYALGTMGLRAASFLLIPIYTHSLPVHDYGLLAVLLQTAQIMIIVMSLGSRTALIRFAKEYDEKDRAGVLLGTSLLITAAGAVLVTIIATLFLPPLFKSVLHTENVSTFVLLTCAGAGFNCLSIHLISYYRAGQEGLKVIMVSLLGAVSLIVLTLVFFRVLHLGIYGALLAQAIAFGALTAFLLVTVSSKTRLELSMPLAWDLVRFGLPLILVMAGGLITQGSAIYFLSYFRGLEEVGVYSLGLKMAQISEMVLILPFQMAYEPFVFGHIGDSRLWSTISRLLTYLMIAFAFVACGIVFVARDLMPWIAPPAYGSAYFLIFLIVPAISFRGVYYIGESLLYIERRTRLVGTIVATFTVLSVALNYLWIWRWGMYGAIAVFALTTVCTAVVVMKLGLRMSSVRIETDRLWVAATALFVFLATVYALHDTSRLVYYSLIPAAVFAGALLLYVSGFTKKEERRAIQHFVGRGYGLGSASDA